ncbi:transposase [Bacillus sp. 7586-K]|nr:transposase [Bacillus sp. 7586-K]
MNRKTATRQKVDEAIKRLVGTNESINFNSVANESGVSKATLYNNVPIRESIEALRQQQSLAHTQLKREMNENNKDALIESLKRKIKKLDNENKQLKEQLKVVYAEVYKKV